MPKTKLWHACLPGAERAPCDYELRLACGWWYHNRGDDEEECHKRAERPGWLEATRGKPA